MAFCTKCGTQLGEGAAFCHGCGASVNGAVVNNRPAENDQTFGWGVLGFFIPIVGLILFLLWKDEYPKRSKSAGIGALVSVIAGVALYIILIVLMFIFASVASTAAVLAW